MALNRLHADLGDIDADITSHDTFVRCVPHLAFARMRREQPVAWVEEADGDGFWAVTKHADVSVVSRDFSRFTASRGIRIEQMSDDELEARRTMMEFDPPEHARLRRLVQPGFTPRVVATYESAFRFLTGHVLDTILPLGEFDFVTEISRELPIRLLCRLLGVPETDAWGRRFTYRVTLASADDPAAGALSSFALTGNIGDITVNDGAGVAIATSVPAIIVSHGKNGLGSFGPDGAQWGGAAGNELENADNDTTFVSQINAPTFDDLVVWIPPNLLKSRMVAAGRLP